MRPTLYTVRLPDLGPLSTMAKPRGGEWLEDEMGALAAGGVDTLVCALTRQEQHETGLTAQAQAAASVGLHFVQLPVTDRSVPDPATVLPALRDLADRLRDGAHIVTHCRFGIGRASLLAAALLVLNHIPPRTAWHYLEQARGRPVPDTPEQRHWTTTLTPHA